MTLFCNHLDIQPTILNALEMGYPPTGKVIIELSTLYIYNI